MGSLGCQTFCGSNSLQRVQWSSGLKLQSSVFLPVYQGSEQKCVLFMLLPFSIFFRLGRENHLQSQMCFPECCVWEEHNFSRY